MVDYEWLSQDEKNRIDFIIGSSVRDSYLICLCLCVSGGGLIELVGTPVSVSDGQPVADHGTNGAKGHHLNGQGAEYGI